MNNKLFNGLFINLMEQNSIVLIIIGAIFVLIVIIIICWCCNAHDSEEKEPKSIQHEPFVNQNPGIEAILPPLFYTGHLPDPLKQEDLAEKFVSKV
jgi:uncharacterized alpha/beta hydrolase family protein